MELQALIEGLDVHAVLLQDYKLRTDSKIPIFLVLLRSWWIDQMVMVVVAFWLQVSQFTVETYCFAYSLRLLMQTRSVVHHYDQYN